MTVGIKGEQTNYEIGVGTIAVTDEVAVDPLRKSILSTAAKDSIRYLFVSIYYLNSCTVCPSQQMMTLRCVIQEDRSSLSVALRLRSPSVLVLPRPILALAEFFKPSAPGVVSARSTEVPLSLSVEKKKRAPFRFIR